MAKKLMSRYVARLPPGRLVVGTSLPWYSLQMFFFITAIDCKTLIILKTVIKCVVTVVLGKPDLAIMTVTRTWN